REDVYRTPNRGAPLRLGGQVKSGQSWTGSIRPVDSLPRRNARLAARLSPLGICPSRRCPTVQRPLGWRSLATRAPFTHWPDPGCPRLAGSRRPPRYDMEIVNAYDPDIVLEDDLDAGRIVAFYLPANYHKQLARYIGLLVFQHVQYIGSLRQLDPSMSQTPV